MRAASKNLTLRVHKASGQAYINVAGRRKYIGRADLPDVKERYQRALAELAANGIAGGSVAVLSVAELLAAFLEHYEANYFGSDANGGRRLRFCKAVIKPVRELYGRSLVEDFGPKRLRAVQHVFVGKGWSRAFVNRSVVFVKSVFRWGMGRELVNESVVRRLEAVEPLKHGQTTAPEMERVKPVSDDAVNKTLPYLTRTVRAMVELQRLTGMRPQEACDVRVCDIEVAGKVWIYRPAKHKSKWRGEVREVILGPRAQRVLQPFLTTNTQTYVFSPADSVQEHRDRRTAARKTPLGQGNSIGSNRVEKPKRGAGEHYTSDAFGAAITYACSRAFPVPDGADATEAAAWRKANWWRACPVDS